MCFARFSPSVPSISLYGIGQMIFLMDSNRATMFFLKRALHHYNLQNFDEHQTSKCNLTVNVPELELWCRKSFNSWWENETNVLSSKVFKIRSSLTSEVSRSQKLMPLTLAEFLSVINTSG
jgi:hypothetical protein